MLFLVKGRQLSYETVWVSLENAYLIMVSWVCWSVDLFSNFQLASTYFSAVKFLCSVAWCLQFSNTLRLCMITLCGLHQPVWLCKHKQLQESYNDDHKHFRIFWLDFSEIIWHTYTLTLNQIEKKTIWKVWDRKSVV